MAPSRCETCIASDVRERGKQHKRRQRAKRWGVDHGPYSLAEVAERDGFVCRLCWRPVNMVRVVPHPGAPTLDHKIPLARGGPDTESNIQLAHFLCNSTKSDGSWGGRVVRIS
ncbi:MAG: HNH endonuclease [Labedaea sp.]